MRPPLPTPNAPTPNDAIAPTKDRLSDTLLHRLAALPQAAWTRLHQPHADRAALDPPMRSHARALMRALRRRLIAGNQIDLLINKPATYAAMFEAIDAAINHINIESYIVEADGPNEELARRLLTKCREDITVNLLFDGFNSLTTETAYFEMLRAGSVQLYEYNPLRS